MIPKDKQSNVYDYFFDIKDGKFKLWDTLVDTSPIPADAKVLPSLFSGYILVLACTAMAAELNTEDVGCADTEHSGANHRHCSLYLPPQPCRL